MNNEPIVGEGSEGVEEVVLTPEVEVEEAEEESEEVLEGITEDSDEEISAVEGEVEASV